VLEPYSAIEHLVLAPFMNLAHAFYRPVALFFLALSCRPVGRRTTLDPTRGKENSHDHHAATRDP
jgi:hypothetical protein